MIISPENEVIFKANLEALALKVAVTDGSMLLDELAKNLALFELAPGVSSILALVLSEASKKLAVPSVSDTNAMPPIQVVVPPVN